MDKDEIILRAFRNARNMGRKEISNETLSIMAGLNRQECNKKLNVLSKYNIVKRTQKKPVTFWELLD